MKPVKDFTSDIEIAKEKYADNEYLIREYNYLLELTKAYHLVSVDVEENLGKSLCSRSDATTFHPIAHELRQMRAQLIMLMHEASLDNKQFEVLIKNEGDCFALIKTK